MSTFTMADVALRRPIGSMAPYDLDDGYDVCPRTTIIADGGFRVDRFGSVWQEEVGGVWFTTVNMSGYPTRRAAAQAILRAVNLGRS